MSHNQIFNAIAHPAPSGNVFDLSHSHRGTGKFGYLMPMYTEELLAGDRISINARNLIRLMPLVTPAMDRIQVLASAFFVPFRLCWPGDTANGTGWESFFTNGGEQEGTTPPAMPQYTGSYQFNVGGFHDYLGLPVDKLMSVAHGTPVSALYRQAYSLIFWEWYRDQNLQGTNAGFIRPTLTPGATNAVNDQLFRRNWPRDYYMASLPFAQKGPAIAMPVSASITGQSPVELDPLANPLTTPPIFRATPTATGFLTGPVEGDVAVPGHMSVGGTADAFMDPNGSLMVDGQFFNLGAIQTTINDFRTALALQAWLELNAVGGTRFIEALKVHFGTSPHDARLQRPELIGSSFQQIAVSEVLQTSESTATSPLGTMGGHGISSNSKGFFRYRAQEPGVLMILVSIFPDAAYSQGLHRMFTRQSYFDFAWPSFAKLGEQATLKREVNAKTAAAPASALLYNESVFGYMPRFAEYRYHNNHTTGLFRPGQSMDAWTSTLHYDDNISAPLELNSTFIECNPPERIFNIQPPATVDAHFLMQWHFNIKCYRLLPKYGTPSNLS